MATAGNDIVLPEILLYEQHHDLYEKRSMLNNIEDLIHLRNTSKYIDILTTYVAVDKVEIFKNVFQYSNIKKITNTIFNKSDFGNSNYLFVFVEGTDNFIFKMGKLYISKNKNGNVGKSEDDTKILRFFNSNNMSGISKFTDEIKIICDFVASDICNIDSKIFNHSIMFYQAQKDFSNMANNKCQPNGIVLEVMLDKIRMICEVFTEEIFVQKNAELKNLWLTVTKTYYSTSNLEIPESLEINEQQLENQLPLKLKFEHEMFSLDNELEKINALTKNTFDLKEILNNSQNEENYKKYCESLVNLLVEGSELLLKFKERNVNYWFLLTRIAKIPINLYEISFNSTEPQICLTPEIGNKLVKNFGIWINAISSSSIVHIYKYAYYLVLYKLFNCNRLIQNEQTYVNSMLEEFVISCNLTQIYDITTINDINLIKNAIINLKPIWFSNTEQYKSKLNILYDLIKNDNNIQAEQPIQANIMFKNFFDANIECYAELTGSLEAINTIQCDNDKLKTGYIKSTFNEVDENNSVIITKEVRFSSLAIELNKHRIMTDNLCSAFYFPNLNDISLNASTCYSILLQIINTCRLRKISQNNYPFGFAGDCELKPLKSEYNTVNEYIFYTADINVHEILPMDNIDTSINISGTRVSQENDDSIYNFIKYLYTDDKKYLQNMLCFVKYGHSLGFNEIKQSCENILKYGDSQQITKENTFSNNSLFTNENQIDIFYKLMTNEETFITEIEKKLENNSLDKLSYNIFLFVCLIFLKESDKILKKITPQKLYTLEELGSKENIEKINGHNLLCIISNAIKYYATNSDINTVKKYTGYLNNIIDKTHETFNYSKQKVIKKITTVDIDEIVHYLKFPLYEFRSNYNLNKRSSGGKYEATKTPENMLKPTRYRYGDAVFSHGDAETRDLTSLLRQFNGMPVDAQYSHIDGNGKETMGFDYGSIFVIPAYKLLDQDMYDPRNNSLQQVMSTNADKLYKYNSDYLHDAENDQEGGNGEKDGKSSGWKSNVSGTSDGWRGQSRQTNSGTSNGWGRQTNSGTSDGWGRQQRNDDRGFDNRRQRELSCRDNNVLCQEHFLGNPITEIDSREKLIETARELKTDTKEFENMVKNFIQDRRDKQGVNVEKNIVEQKFNFLLEFVLSNKEPIMLTMDDMAQQLHLKMNYLYSLKRKLDSYYKNKSKNKKLPTRELVNTPLAPSNVQTSEKLIFDEKICALFKMLDHEKFSKQRVESAYVQSYIDITKSDRANTEMIKEKLNFLHKNYVEENRDIINSLSAREYGQLVNGLVRVFEKKVGTELRWIQLSAKKESQRKNYFYYPKSEIKCPIRILQNLDYNIQTINDLLTNNTKLLDILSGMGNVAYVDNYHHVVKLLSNKEFADKYPHLSVSPNGYIQYISQEFPGINKTTNEHDTVKHSHEFPIYSHKWNLNRDSYIDDKLSSLIMCSIGSFLEYNKIIVDMYKIDGFQYEKKLKQYVKHYKSEKLPKNIYLTQNSNDGMVQMLIKLDELTEKENISDNVLENHKKYTNRKISNKSETVNINVCEFEFILGEKRVKHNIIRNVNIFNKQFDNIIDESTILNTYVNGYLDNNSDINIYTPFHISNKYIVNNWQWFKNVGQAKDYPNYDLELVDEKVYKKESGEQFVSLIDVMMDDKFTGLIDTFLHIADSIDDVLMWTKNGKLSSVDFIKSKINFKFIGNTIVINDEYEIINKNKWLLQRWTANVPNLLMVTDKYKNHFIYVLPIGQNPYVSELKESRQTICNTVRLNQLTGKTKYIGQSEKTSKPQLINLSENEIRSVLNEKNLQIQKDIVKKSNNLLEEFSNQSGLPNDEDLQSLLLCILDYYSGDETECDGVEKEDLLKYGKFLYEKYNTLSAEPKQEKQTKLEKYLLEEDVMKNISNRMEFVKYANMFKDNFDNIERYSNDIAKEYLVYISPDVKEPSNKNIEDCTKNIKNLVQYYKQILEGKFTNTINEQYQKIEQFLYKYVRTNFGLSTDSEKLIKMNMITLMPIINNKQTLEQLCLSYLNFHEIGNIYELSDTIRKMNIDLNDYLMTSIKSCFNYNDLGKCIENHRFRLPSFAKVQSSLIKQVHNLGKSYTIDYNYIYDISSQIDIEKDHEMLVNEYFFPEDYKYTMPTFCEYLLHSLLNKDKRNGVFSMFIEKMKQNSTTYSSDVKIEFDNLINQITTESKTFKANPLEFLYQCLAGFFARPVQQSIANHIIEDICENRILTQTGGYKVFSDSLIIDKDIEMTTKLDKSGRIHTLIMGGGKTKMITPLVILKYLQQISIYHLKQKLKGNVESTFGNHMYLVLPDSLVNQSYEHLVMLNMYFPIIVHKLEESRNDISQFAQSVSKSNELEMNLFIMSDTTMKCGILNDIDSNIQKNSTKHCYLFDEVDTILDPIISELNYPDEKTTTPLRSIDKFYETVYEILYDVFVENPTEIKQYLSDHNDQYLTTPHFYLKTKGLLLTKLVEYAFKKCIESFKSNEKITKGLQNRNIDKEYLDSLNDEDIGILISLHNFINEAFPSCLTLRNRHHYGLSETIPKMQKEILPIVVPFSYAEKPREDSSFSNPVLVMVLTTIDYLVQNKPKKLPTIIIDHMISLVNDLLKEYPHEYIQHSNIYKEYTNLKLSIAPENIKNTQNLTDDDIEKLRHSKLFIKIICQHNCAKYIKFSTSQENISGLDLVMSNNTTYRSGFTGTPNIPNFIDMYKDKALTIAQENTINGEKSTNEKINETILKSNIIIANNNDDIISYIQNVIEKLNDHTVLIDVGAVLVGTTPQMIFEIVKKLRPSLQQFIYWNNKDLPMTKNKAGKELLWTGSMTNNMFYYYDNMHTTGIDAQIDQTAKGIVLLGSTSRYRDVAQGMYRMRKLHVENGQKITFVINEKIKKDINQTALLEWFNTDELKYLTSQQRLMNNQNILALSRYQIVNQKRMHLLDNAFSYPSVKTLDNLKLITGEESLRHKYIVDAKEKIIEKIKNNELTNYDKITEIDVENIVNVGSISMSLQQEIEQTKELQQNYEKRQNKTLEIITGKQYLISNNNINDYYLSDNIIYYDTIITDKIYKSKNLKYYLSPYIITYSDGKFYVLPFVEGYKLFNTYIDGNNMSEFPKDVMFCDSNGIGFNGKNELVQTLSIFIAKKIDAFTYISLTDYLNMFKIIKEGSQIAKELLEILTDDKSSNNIFMLFSKAIVTYKNYTTECDKLIEQYNQLEISLRTQFYFEIAEEFKSVFSFLTLNGNILENINL